MSWFKRLFRSRPPRLEIHLPISPTPFFFNRVHYFAASLRLNGGSLADSRIIVTIGDAGEPFDVAAAQPWSRHYPIEWRWLARDVFVEHSYFATRLQRFCYDYQADAVLLLDADVLVAAPFADLITRVVSEQKLLGVPANASPLRNGFTWERLFERAGLGAVPYEAEHSGFGCIFHDAEKKQTPPYFNFGVLPVPTALARRIGENIYAELDIVRTLEDFYRGQMSTTLAIVRQGIPWGTMPFKYNFVNDERYLPRYEDDFNDLRLMHFLSNGTIHKDRTFDSVASVEQVLAGEYANRVDRRFVEILRPVHEQVLTRL